MSDQNTELAELKEAVERLEAKQAEILAVVNEFILQAKPVVDQVVPTIESITQIPVIRMALGLKKGELTTNGKR